MMLLKDELLSEVKRLRNEGVSEELFVVPVAHIRCFVACKSGECICVSTIKTNYCVVNSNGKRKSLEYANSTIQYLNDTLHHILIELDINV